MILHLLVDASWRSPNETLGYTFGIVSSVLFVSLSWREPANASSLRDEHDDDDDDDLVYF